MKLFIVALLVLGAFAQNEGEQGQAEVIEQETIQCESGTYIDGLLQNTDDRVIVNCTSRWRENRIDPPRCQTKVEERYSFETQVNSAFPEGQKVRSEVVHVVKSCKTEHSCNMNARLFKERGDCDEATDEDVYFRICVSCCNSDDCNSGLDSLVDARGYEPAP